uniref:SH3 domain-containing protein n=1 Tax=Glossina morsitans morsitans TaxID=37546 RepID=A0A1B0G372_GLOMM
MNKTCARCQKIVYPIEELKCLDKLSRTLALPQQAVSSHYNYWVVQLDLFPISGFNKTKNRLHIPKAKATAIADTPELKRIAENTKIQSNVKYHEDFEKAKGKFTQVADDPETLRIKQNTKIISNVAYHGDLEKKAQMEKQRGAAEISDIKANVNQSITHQQQQAQQQSQSAYQQPNNSYNQLRSAILQSAHHPTGGSNIDPALPSSTAATVSSYAYDQYDNSYARPSFQQNNNNNVTNSTATSSNVAASSTGYQPPGKQSFVVGGSSGSGGGYPINSNNSYSTQQLFASTNYNSYPSSATTLPPSPRSSFGVRVYRALYDYEAQDIDEVSFREGDIIFEVEAIDSGWMTGRVERTGKTGMLPANYVEQAVI